MPSGQYLNDFLCKKFQPQAHRVPVPMAVRRILSPTQNLRDMDWAAVLDELVIAADEDRSSQPLF